MSMRLFSRKTGATVCALMMLFAATMPAQAAMVGTDQILNEARSEADRAELASMLDRDAVRSQLRALGVDPKAAQERVARMTDAEVARLQAGIQQLPAGEGIGGALLLVFLVFVITDVIGATDLFPFIESVD